MKTIHTIFTDEEFARILKIKERVGGEKKISWHDFIWIIAIFKGKYLK